jgi:hypothetical protein
MSTVAPVIAALVELVTGAGALTAKCRQIRPRSHGAHQRLPEQAEDRDCDQDSVRGVPDEIPNATWSAFCCGGGSSASEPRNGVQIRGLSRSGSSTHDASGSPS